MATHRLDPLDEADDGLAEMKRLGGEGSEEEDTGRTDIPAVHVHTHAAAKSDSERPPRKQLPSEQSRIVQLTALVTAAGAIVISLVSTFRPDNSKDQAAYEKMREMYEAVRKDAVRQNGDNAVTRTEVGRLDDEKTREFEAMRKELDQLREKAKLPGNVNGAPGPTPSLAPVAPVTLPKSLDDVPAMPKR